MSSTISAPADALGRQDAPASAPRTKKRRNSTRRREGRIGMLYASPAAAFVTILFLIPMVLAIVMSLNKWPLIGNPSFNAPENYTDIASNKLFLDSIFFTLKYTVITTVVFLVLSLALALLVQNSRPGVGFFRTAFLLPASVGVASCSLLFLALYDNNFGPLDDILNAVGLAHGHVDFLGTPDSSFASVLVMVIWRFTGFNMIILLTGLQAIPVEVYEAARSDGASWWQTLRYVTIPLLKKTILLILVLTVTGGLLAFEPFYVMTQGGPDNSTVTMVIAMFREAFTLFNLGSAAAIAMVLLVVLVAINALQLFLFRDRETER
jgi:multiple sugar transport system permease protein